ncbi:hypothetical protein HPB48_011369 [Haemaphysalis longicornis]|uniref:Cytochrome P450 n=1 Tax=Haemaphysalis longicornis TaxID=44386 RepID=A0A9J6G463_HAELO|nr:hypothetical protein HPB48_011369 [Haemaphysalis longicornis]
MACQRIPLQPECIDLTEVEALSQCVLFFLAGQDTASTASTFATYLLATNPHVQDRLRAEVDECFRKHGSSPSYDEVAKLPYLDCVVNETLRIMPPGARLERCPAEDYVLGDTGIKVPSDCVIVVPVYAMHMDPEFFPEPEVFNPDRQVTSPSQLFLGGRRKILASPFQGGASRVPAGIRHPPGRRGCRGCQGTKELTDHSLHVTDGTHSN